MKNSYYGNIVLVLLLCSVYQVDAQNKLKRIKVQENDFITAANEAIVFRGLSTSDPDKLESDGLWNTSYFAEIKNWGANIVRFPIHPSAWKKRGVENYLKLLDNGIQWAGELGMYVVIDWHSIGNLQTKKYQHERYYTTKKQTYAFWKIIAQRYGDNPTVAFYELFNEPTTMSEKLGAISWTQWKKINRKMIKIIRTNGGNGIPLVAGFNWAYDLSPIKNSPLKEDGIAYVSHPYPQKRDKPWEEKWTKDWGFVSEKYPMILTELGFSGPNDLGAHRPTISDESYGKAITEYCDKRGISYVVWVFDKKWAPRLYEDDDYTPSRQGKFFKKKLQSYIN